MGTISRQIGWNTKQILLWQISKELERTLKISSNNTVITTSTTTTSAPILNRFEYSTGTAPSIVDFETTIGFTLTDGLKVGDVITFSDSGYTVPVNAFLNSTLVSVDTLAISVLTSSFRGCFNLTYFSAPILTSTDPGSFAFNSSVLSYNLPSITSIGANSFGDNELVTNFEFPLVTVVGNSGFDGCSSAVFFDLSAVINLGQSVGDNNVFRGINTNVVTLIIPSAIMTVNGGNPDGDIQLLQANNTVTIINT